MVSNGVQEKEQEGLRKATGDEELHEQMEQNPTMCTHPEASAEVRVQARRL